MSTALRDRLLAGACAVLQLAAIRSGPPVETSVAADVAASAAAVLAGVAVTWRRGRPLSVLAGTTLLYVAQAALVGPVLPAAALAAAYAAARFGPQPVGALAGSATAAVVGGTAALLDDAATAPAYVALLLAAVLAGSLLAAQAARRAALVRDAAAEERLRIARDLHDIVGHGMGAIAVQSGTGRLALDAGQVDVARRALSTVEEASRDVLREVRWLVGLLRDQPRSPGLDAIEDLAAAARLAGLEVRTRVAVTSDGVTAAVAEATYRIVQEALTNVVRHARDAREVVVTVDIGDTVHVEVRDDGTATTPLGAGHGLAGMRERAAAVHGRFAAGPGSDGSGWAVTADLPGGGR